MRRNKVLTTLAAVSMSAMMAVSAAPVMAATETTAETTNVGDQSSVVTLNSNNVQIKGTTYGQAPVVTVNDGKTVLKEGRDFQFEQNGKTVKGSDLAKLNAGQTVHVNVIAVTGSNYEGTVQNVSYKIQKANLNLSVSVKSSNKQEGRAFREYNPVVSGVPKDYKGTTKLKLIKDGKEVGDYTGKSIAGTKGDYTVELRASGDQNYNAFGYNANGSEAATPATASFSITEEDNVNKKLNIKLNDSTYGATPTIEFLDNEDADTLNDEVRDVTVDVYSVETEPVDKKDASKGTKVKIVDGEPVRAEKLFSTKVKNNEDTTKVAPIKNVTKTTDLLDAGTYIVDVYATDEKGNYNYAEGELRDQVVKVNKLNLNSLKLAKASEPFKGYSYDLSNGTSVDAKYGVSYANGKYTFGNLAVVPASEYTFSATGTNVSKNGDTYYGTHAGKYTLTATAKATSKNFTGKVSTEFTITGNRAQNVYLTANNTTYNHKAYNGASAEASTKTTLSYYKYDASKENGVGQALASAPTDAGTYVVRAYTPGDDNYRAAEAFKTFTISPATIASISYNAERDYDGTATMPELVIKDQYGEVVSKDNYTFKHVADYTNDDGKDAVKHQGTLTLKKNYKNVGALTGEDGSYTVDKDAAAKTYTLGYTIKPYNLLNSKDQTRVVVDDGLINQTPEVHVYAINGNEIPASDYKVTATNNGRVGTGNVNIAGIPNGHVYSDGTKIQNVTNSVSQKYNVVKAVSMYRVYNPNSGEHFFTGSKAERDHLVSLGWRNEGVAWNAPTSGTPVYRVYNKRGGEHHYTTNKAEVANLVAHGWRDEGIGWYSAKATAKGAKPVYRVFNKKAFANNHHYTTSKGEANSLIKLGWRDEGIAFYEY